MTFSSSVTGQTAVILCGWKVNHSVRSHTGLYVPLFRLVGAKPIGAAPHGLFAPTQLVPHSTFTRALDNLTSYYYEAVTVNLFNTTVTRGAIFSSKCTRIYLAVGLCSNPLGSLQHSQTSSMDLRVGAREGKRMAKEGSKGIKGREEESNGGVEEEGCRGGG